MDDGGWAIDSDGRATTTEGCEMVWRGDREKLRYVGDVKSARYKRGVIVLKKKKIINCTHELRKRLSFHKK